MKALRRIILTVAAAAISLTMSAQAQINTKKVKIADFPTKTTKVVLTGNEIFDTYVKSDFNSCWRISPYEFCDLAEFDKLKTSPDYYFIMFTKGQFRKEVEPGLDFITLVKGGSGADKSIADMLEIVCIPFRSSEDPSGRESSYIPVLLDIIQKYTTDSIEKDIDGYMGLSNATINLPKAKGKKIVIADGDLSPQVDENAVKSLFNANMSVMDIDDADALLDDADPSTVISFTVAPTNPGKGSYCYKMLINAGTHELYYYRKHRISPKTGTGFLTEDIKRIANNTK